jgi:hypothetical protein
MNWDIARYARGNCVHKQLVLAEVRVDPFADSKLVEVIWIPSENLEDCGTELFEGSLVGDLEVAAPSWDEIARLDWQRVDSLSGIFNAQGVALLYTLSPARHAELSSSGRSHCPATARMPADLLFLGTYQDLRPPGEHSTACE